MAERRESFPQVMSAFESGELSLEQVVELVKAPTWADGLVLDWGRVATVARLRRTIRRDWFTGAPDEADVDHAAAPDRDRVSTSGNADDPDGMVLTDSRGSPLESCSKPNPAANAPPSPDRPYQPPLRGRVDDQWVGLGWVHSDEQLRRRTRHRGS